MKRPYRPPRINTPVECLAGIIVQELIRQKVFELFDPDDIRTSDSRRGIELRFRRVRHALDVLSLEIGQRGVCP